MIKNENNKNRKPRILLQDSCLSLNPGSDVILLYCTEFLNYI